MTQAIIVHGNPVDGFNFIGPFPDQATAAEHGNKDGNIDGDWWVAPLEAPNQEDAVDG